MRLLKHVVLRQDFRISGTHKGFAVVHSDLVAGCSVVRNVCVWWDMKESSKQSTGWQHALGICTASTAQCLVRWTLATPLKGPRLRFLCLLIGLLQDPTSRASVTDLQRVLTLPFISLGLLGLGTKSFHTATSLAVFKLNRFTESKLPSAGVCIHLRCQLGAKPSILDPLAMLSAIPQPLIVRLGGDHVDQHIGG